MQEDNKIKEVMSATIKELGSLIDAKTIIGEPCTYVDGTVIIPVSKVTMGIVTGGGEYGKVKTFDKSASLPFSGGSGVVVSMKPAAFLVDDGKGIKLINVANDLYERMFETADELIKNLNKNAET
ncbi:MAG: sporulation protein YtfJ [Clostridia bacterium]|nr:sporulation protein YtfJ [Clostridia bacterium]